VTRSEHPSTDPDREEALRLGERMYPRMRATFENEAEERDYLRRVRANDNNIPGLPSIAMFPPDEIREHVPDKAARMCKVPGCGGCCTYIDHYVCPRCGTQN
jgi:hypothetical protein